MNIAFAWSQVHRVVMHITGTVTQSHYFTIKATITLLRKLQFQPDFSISNIASPKMTSTLKMILLNFLLLELMVSVSQVYMLTTNKYCLGKMMIWQTLYSIKGLVFVVKTKWKLHHSQSRMEKLFNLHAKVKFSKNKFVTNFYEYFSPFKYGHFNIFKLVTDTSLCSAL